MAETYVHPELRNLAEDLEEEELGEIASECIEDYRKDEESRQEWLNRHAEWLNLYFQNDRPKNPPWEGSSTESIPMLAEACTQFHTRAFQAMFPTRDIIRAVPVGKWDEIAEERAKRVATHMSWQLMVKDGQYRRNKDRLLLSLPLHGAYFTKTYYSPDRKRPVVENVRAVDLVVPYGTGPRNLEDIERKSQIIYMPLTKAAILQRDGFFSDLPEAYELDDKTPTDRAYEEVEGFQRNAYRERGDAKIIEQHRLLDLDDDGIAEPYIVWVDLQSEKVLRLAIRWDTDEVGQPTDNKRPVEYFTDYSFLENPDGFYGLGYGHLIGPLNTAVNKLLRQSVDAGTLSNVLSLSGFVNKAAGLKKGELQLQLGKFVATESSAEDLNKMIYQPRAVGPNAALLQVMELIMMRGDRLATVTEAITGQMDKVVQPTAVMALIEQSLQVFSAVFERVVYSWSLELEKIYRLNRKFLDPVEYFSVLDVGGQISSEEIKRADYADDLQVLPIADPRMVTKKQKVTKAEIVHQSIMQLYQIMLANPLVQTSPDAVLDLLVKITESTRKFLEAAEVEYIDQVMPDLEVLANGLIAMATQAGMAQGQADVTGEVRPELAGDANVGGNSPSQGAGGSS